MDAPKEALLPNECSQLERARQEFATACQQDTPPVIEAHIATVAVQLQAALIGELVRLELAWRLQRGEQPQVAEYAARFPDLEPHLSAWLATAQAAEAKRRSHSTTDLPAIESFWFANLTGGSSAIAWPQPTAGPVLPVVPRTVGEYELLERIGAGGMGEVWQARHRKLDKLVAVKLLLPSKAPNPQAVERFLREMKAIGQLDSPYFVEALDAGASGDCIYLAMKLLDGQDLAKYVDANGPFAVPEACDLARQIAWGLQHLHERGLVHRDLKPSNVMRLPNGSIKILDLGLARWHLGTAPLAGEVTRSGQALGTPDYIAPEQVVSARKVDVRPDLYTLGATLFFLLTGQALSHVAGVEGKLKAHEQMLPPNLSHLHPELPARLVNLVEQLLAKNPADRPASAAAVADALTAILEQPPTPIPVPDRFTPKRRRVGLWLGLGVVLVFLFGSCVESWLMGRHRPSVFQNLAAPSSPTVTLPPTTTIVRQFAVKHTERRGNAGHERGLFGHASFVARWGDRASVEVELNRPAYAYLLAYAANGREHLLSPPEAHLVPERTKQVSYPPAGVQEDYELNDGVGLHIFLAVISDEPLPSYLDWRQQHGQAPWAPIPGRFGAVWRQVGGDLHAATAADPDVRGPKAEALGVAPVQTLVAWWRQRPGVAQVALIGFSVTKDD